MFRKISSGNTVLGTVTVASLLALSAAACAQSATQTVDLRVRDTATQENAALADSAITARVAALLAADDKLTGNAIQVSTSRGVVSLSGRLSKTVMIYRAIELTRRVEGVKRVDDTDLSTL